MTIETVACVGLGAIGAAFMSKISRALPEGRAFVIADGERAARLRRGMTLNGEPFRIAVREPSEAEHVGLVLISVKFGALGRAIELAAPFVGPDTAVMSLLNGVSSEEALIEAFGRDRVLYALCTGTDSMREGSSVVVTDDGKIQFGELTNDSEHPSPRVAAVAELFTRTGVAHEVPADMRVAQWRKFMTNVAVNQTCAAIGCPYGGVQRSEAAMEIARSAMREVLAVARAIGIGLTEDDVERSVAAIMRSAPHAKPSTLQDVEARRPTEAAMFGGAVRSMGREHGVPTPVCGMLYDMIRAKEELYGKEMQ